jgi:hypothetical protein
MHNMLQGFGDVAMQSLCWSLSGRERYSADTDKIVLCLQHAQARCDLGSKTAALQESTEQLGLATMGATTLENRLAKLRSELSDTAAALEVAS